MSRIMSSGRRRYCAIVCGLGFVLSLAFLIFSDGAQKLPWDVPDSHGRVFSFNIPMSWEHYALAFRAATMRGTLEQLGLYGAIFVVAQLVGLGLVTMAPDREWLAVRRYFMLQFGFFPFGLIAMPFLPLMFLMGGIDAEFVTDGPPFWWWAQGIWAIASALIAFGRPLRLLAAGRHARPDWIECQ
jgi:hypothetical protein